MLSGLKKRLNKSFSRAGEILTGVGTSPVKQFKNAIIDGDEEKAISIYTAEDNEKPLSSELNPSKPFPSAKKTVSADIPLHLSAKSALYKLVLLLLENGGDPSTLNVRKETVLHAVCSSDGNPAARASILATLIQWDRNGYDKVSINQVDVEGNTAIHYAASNGLLSCVEKLVAMGAIISIVNKSNNTCCEMADESGHKQLASMLELALVFQPVDEEMEQFDREQTFPYENQPGRLLIQAFSLSSMGLTRFIDESISAIFESCSSDDLRMSRARAEVLLHKYNWDANKLQIEYLTDSEKVLTVANLSAEATTETTTAQSSSTIVAGEPPKSADLDLDEIGFSIAENADFSFAPDSKGFSQFEDYNATTPVGVCASCGDSMLKAVPAKLLISDNISEPMSRELKCQSGHSYCVNCWSSYLTVQVRDNGAGSLKCPGIKCGEILDIEWAPVLLQSSDLVVRFTAQRQRSIQDCSGLKSCTNESCGLFLHLPSTSSADDSDKTLAHGIPLCAICSNGHGFCLSCSLQLHSPCTCSQMQKWLQQVQEETKLVNSDVSGDDIANALWVAANTKRCPRCNTPIEKDEGCNHMSCRKCRKEFCWICMQDWNLHSDNTGGYFQCNKFVDSTPNDKAGADASNSDGAVMDMLWAEERGNAHAETMRLREKGKRMARFIHYFTRYQAHGESVKMETKMKLDTVERITFGLKACAREHGGWYQEHSQSSLKASSEPPMIWLQSIAMENPILPQTSHVSAAGSSHLKAPATQDSNSSNIVANSYLQPEECLKFLAEGFDELLKCRSFLQWSYPYAYFEFSDSEDGSSRSKNWRKMKYQQDHRLSFEALQSDLEAMVETLSDVVARRRLRAARSQICLATRAAKSKRIELEYLLISYAITKVALEDGSAAESSSSRHHNSSSSRNRRPMPSWRTRLQERVAELTQQQDAGNYWVPHTSLNSLRQSTYRENESDDEDELTAYIYDQFARNNSPGQTAASVAGTTPSRQGNGSNAEISGVPQSLNDFSVSSGSVHRDAPSSTTPSSQLAARNSAPSTSGTLRRRRKTSRVRGSEGDTTPGGEESTQMVAGADVADTSDIQLLEEGDDFVVGDGDDIEGEDGAGEEEGWEDVPISAPFDTPVATTRTTPTSHRRRSRTSATPSSTAAESGHRVRDSRMDELSELNRAILLSLQDASSSSSMSPGSNNAPAQDGLATNDEPSSPSESDIELLVSMGFSREQAQQALRESRGNVELAANRLLESL